MRWWESIVGLTFPREMFLHAWNYKLPVAEEQTKADETAESWENARFGTLLNQSTKKRNTHVVLV